MTEHRGSRKHVLGWVARTDFVSSLNAVVDGTSAVVDGNRDHWMPTAKCADEARLETTGRTLLPDPALADELASWWLAHRKGANTPNWDLASTCHIGGKPGLILVEAKAHEGELDRGGKRPPDPDNPRSKENHERIGDAIVEAQHALAEQLPGIAISRDRHYQLSNRIAFAWKLASRGVPVVLVYLGFTGDTYFKSDYLRDGDHWRRVMDGYVMGVLPLGLPSKPVPCGPSSLAILVRAIEHETRRRG